MKALFEVLLRAVSHIIAILVLMVVIASLIGIGEGGPTKFDIMLTHGNTSQDLFRNATGKTEGIFGQVHSKKQSQVVFEKLPNGVGVVRRATNETHQAQTDFRYWFQQLIKFFSEISRDIANVGLNTFNVGTRQIPGDGGGTSEWESI